MAERIHVEPDTLREVADQHQQASECLRTVPSSHAAIQESLDSLGPIFRELREAACELLERRRLCYEQQADDHAALADHLRTSAAVWEQSEQDAAARFRSLDDSR